MKRLAFLYAVLPLTLLACNSTVSGGDGGDDGMTKDEARAIGGVDPEGRDVCASEGWYGDGECDDFCVETDRLDCGIPDQCPDPGDVTVHYVSEPGDYTMCLGVAFMCADGHVPFDSPDCGCGCIEVSDPVACGGIEGLACEPGLFCNFTADAMCGAADQLGTCEPLPDACPEYYGPVCGCDGVTYDNPCFANGAGAAVAHDGACEGGGGSTCGGFAGETCTPGEFCDFAVEDICGGADAQGQCQPRPELCPELYSPVCGCDGVTYGNECEANAAGVSISAYEACQAI